MMCIQHAIAQAARLGWPAARGLLQRRAFSLLVVTVAVSALGCGARTGQKGVCSVISGTYRGGMQGLKWELTLQRNGEYVLCAATGGVGRYTCIEAGRYAVSAAEVVFNPQRPRVASEWRAIRSGSSLSIRPPCFEYRVDTHGRAVSPTECASESVLLRRAD